MSRLLARVSDADTNLSKNISTSVHVVKFWLPFKHEELASPMMVQSRVTVPSLGSAEMRTAWRTTLSS